jgi:hypothetical protein
MAELIYVANAHGGKSPLYAIRPEASGDITPAAGHASGGLAWSEMNDPPQSHRIALHDKQGTSRTKHQAQAL